MPEVTRVVRSSYRDEYESDDDSRSTFSRRAKDDGTYRTVQRYRVTPNRDVEVEVDRRSSRLEVAPRGERIEVDRRSERWESERPERPRSAIDIRPPRSTVVERYVDREPIREPERERERERTRTVVYERDTREREPEPLRPWERGPARPWESERDVRETDVVRVEKRTTERREEPYELERYQRETEYYDRPEPPPQPIIIRQRAPEPQQIIVQEAPQPPPIVLPAPAPVQESVQIVRQEIREETPRPEPRRQEDDYYYRRDVREVRDGRRSDEDFAMEKYDRRDVRPRDSTSGDEYSDDEYVIRKKIIRRERSRSRSHSPRHKRHLAEGALAGAGAAALLANHASKQGTGGDHRGRKVIGGAALGAIGAEVLTRARSRYRDSRDDSRSRSRSSSRHSHRKLKTAIGLAAAGLAAAAAAKYVSNRKANKEEIGRGRSRTRSLSRRRSYDDYDDYDDRRSRTRSKSVHADPKHRAATIAKAGAATAAVAGIVEHIRNKSRRRSGERSKSRIRTGAEIAGAGLAGAAVAGLYENRKAKQDDRVEEEEHRRERRRSRTRSRSRARSVGAYSDPGVDPELGMVQYGTEPVYTHTPAYQQGHDHDPVAAGAAYGATRGNRSRSRNHRHRDNSSSEGDTRRRSRSRSRVKDLAAGAAGTAAAAIGINQYRKRKEKKEAERERERRRYEEEAPPENYYARDYPDDGHSPSPPHASGGSYNQFPPPPQAPAGFTHHSNQSTPHVNETTIPPYNPADYANQQASNHDPYGYPPRTGDNVSNDISRQTPYVPSSAPAVAPTAPSAPYFPPPPTIPFEEANEHDWGQQRRTCDPLESVEEGGVTFTPPSTATPSPLHSREGSPSHPSNKSVSFGPMSPTSSRSLARIHNAVVASGSNTHLHSNPSTPSSELKSTDQNSIVCAKAGQTHPRDASPSSTYNSQDLTRHRKSRRRRNSDPPSNGMNQISRHHRRTRSRSPSHSSDESSSEVEVLPDRFNADGRPLDRYGNAYQPRQSSDSGRRLKAQLGWLHGVSRQGFRGGARTYGSNGESSRMDYDHRRISRRDRDRHHEDEDRPEGGQEMVEKLAKDFGDVFEGKKTWKDLLRVFVEDAGSLGAASGSRESLDDREHDARDRHRDRRRRRRDTDRY